MKALLKKGSRIALLLLCFSILLAPLSVVQAGEEDIPRTFSIIEPAPEIVVE
jgi:hypothetical protein